MEFVTIGGNPRLKESTDSELFSLMRQRGSEAEDAWAAFYERYVNELYRFLHRLRGISLEDLVQETMVQAWMSAHTFRVEDESDKRIYRDETLAWLGKIAQNIYFQMHRRQKIELVSSSSEDTKKEDMSPETTGRGNILPGRLTHEIREAENLVAGVPENTKGKISKQTETLLEGLKTLPAREKDILLTTYEYYVPGQKPHLPCEVVAALCETWKITPTYLRKIRERAYKQVERYLKSHLIK
jgi:RNA polymerase sigma factor (sigma-70 family)